MATLIIILILIGCAILAVRSIRKEHQGGGCGCGCSGCSGSCSHVDVYAAYKAGENI